VSRGAVPPNEPADKGCVGSVGVIAAHFDISGMLDQAGVKVSLIQYGEKKSDYSPFKPLSDSARRSLQSDVDMIGEMFIDTVSRNRGLDRAQIRNQEAATYRGIAGVEAGLADAVLSPSAGFADLVAAVSTRRLSAQ
jgi:capsid assembly protease